MRGVNRILLAAALLALAAVIALQTGIARLAFYEMFARVKGVDVLGPTIVRSPPVDSPYERWLMRARTEIPVQDGLVIDDVATVSLRPWPQWGDGINGLYLRFADYQIIDGQIIELPPLGRTASRRHFYEVGIYYIGGPGHTIIEQEGESPLRIDWSAGDIFSVPLNVRYQHFNDSTEPVRLLAVTSFPFVINAVDNEQFIEENPFAFTDRYDGAEDYLGRGQAAAELTDARNFVADARAVELQPYELQGKGARTQRWHMAGNRMLSLHVLEIPPGTYMKAHRHSSDAFILMLSGTGFSVTWPEGRYDRRERVDWRPGTLFVPPVYWYHQHLNTGAVPARHLAINAPELVRNLGLRFEDQLEQDIPEIRAAWEEARR